MAAHYDIVPTEQWHIDELAITMQPEDKAEVWAAGHYTPRQGIELSIANTAEPMTALADGKVLCIFGIAAPSLISDMGAPWLLASPLIKEHRIAFLRGTKAGIVELSRGYKLLRNFVDARHTAAVDWLRWLGFHISAAKPLGPDNVPFRQFEMELD